MDAAGTMTLRDFAHPEPGLLPAGILALLMHVAFLAFLIFGFSWKTAPPEGMVVDLWSSFPEPEPPAQVLVEPQIEKVPVPPQPEVLPPPAKPDIALKQKPEKPKPVEQKRPKEKDLIKAREAEAQQLQRLQREQEAINRQLQARQAAAQARLVDEYRAKINAKIKSRIVTPPNLPGDPVVEFDVTLLPGGDILEVKLKKSSGFAAFDSAVERAIHLSKPLPLPPDPTLFRDFRELSLKLHYRE